MFETVFTCRCALKAIHKQQPFGFSSNQRNVHNSFSARPTVHFPNLRYLLAATPPRPPALQIIAFNSVNLSPPPLQASSECRYRVVTLCQGTSTDSCLSTIQLLLPDIASVIGLLTLNLLSNHNSYTARSNVPWQGAIETTTRAHPLSCWRGTCQKERIHNASPSNYWRTTSQSLRHEFKAWSQHRRLTR